MRNLERRLVALEGESRGGCLECELGRLNRQTLQESQLDQLACRHQHGLTLLDALRGLNPMEIGGMKSARARLQVQTAHVQEGCNALS